MGKSHLIRQQQIIDAVLELAAVHGLGKVTTQMIADHIGIAQPTVFRHFKNRELILIATFEHVIDGLGRQTQPWFEQSGAADLRLAAILAAHLRYAGDNKGLPRFLFSDHLHLHSELLKRRVQLAIEAYVARLAELLQQGKEQGVFRAELETVQTARYLVALIQGVLMRWSLADFNFSMQEQGEQLWQMVAPGLLSNR